MLDVEKTIREYLRDVVHLSLATCAGDQPWVCEVHFVFDDDLNLYFRSKQKRRHSVEIATNPRVAGNIVEQHTADQKPRGVYFEGSAELFEDVDDSHPIVPLFHERIGTDDSIIADARQENGHRFYKISVDTYYLFDSRESSPSHKYELPWGKGN